MNLTKNRATIGLKSNMPVVGMILRIGTMTGSVNSCNRRTIGWWGSMGTQVIMTLASTAQENTTTSISMTRISISSTGFLLELGF